MLYTLLSTIIIIPTLLGMGSIFERIIGKAWTGISAKLFSGTVLLSLFWTVAAFFFPINIYIELISVATGISTFFYFKQNLRLIDFIKENSKAFFPILLVIIFFGAFYPFILDHFGYYIPTIKWISEVGLVKGISNLDLLLGQSSVWHIFQAGFSNFSDPFLRINSVILIIYLIYILEKKSWMHLGFLPILFLFSPSPSPDLPVIVFSLMILNEILKGNKNISLLFAFSVFVFIIKPTVIWLPVFTLLYALLILKSNLKFLIGGSLIFILFLIKNIWTFGFPIFPVQFFDLGLNWAPNKELLKISSEIAIEKTFDMQYTAAEIKNFSTSDYLINWFSIEGIKSKIHIAFALALIVFSVFTFIKKKKIITILLISVLIKSLILLFFSAQYRFLIDVFFVVAFVVFFEMISRKTSLLIFISASIVCGIFLAFPKFIQPHFPSFRLGNYMMGFEKTQFIKPSYFKLEKYQSYDLGNLKLNVVEGYPFSFDIPIPAVSPGYIQEYIDAGIVPQKIRSDLKDGFIWRKASPEELELMKTAFENNRNSIPYSK